MVGGGRGGGFPFGRFVGDGELRLIVLALLSEAPRHGYDIIKALEERSSGFYSPSPGVIYPTLTYLEEAGYATSAAEGNKKVFSITPEGAAHLGENRETVDAILARLEWVGKAPRAGAELSRPAPVRGTRRPRHERCAAGAERGETGGEGGVGGEARALGLRSSGGWRRFCGGRRRRLGGRPRRTRSIFDLFGCGPGRVSIPT